MKKRLSLLAVGILSSMGVSVGAAPVQGSLRLDSVEERLAPPKPPRCNPPCIAGVRG